MIGMLSRKRESRFLKPIPTLLGLFAAAAFLAAIQTFRQSNLLWNAELPFALTVQALTLAVASVRTHFHITKSASPVTITARSAVRALVMFGISMIAIWSGSLSLFDAFSLCNQEYLHWIPNSSHRSFSVPTSSMIAEYAVVGTVSLTIGVFLFWFLFFSSRSATPVELHTATSTSDSNPYRAPQ